MPLDFSRFNRAVTETTREARAIAGEGIRRRRAHNRLRLFFRKFAEPLLLHLSRWGRSCGCAECLSLAVAIERYHVNVCQTKVEL